MRTGKSIREPVFWSQRREFDRSLLVITQQRDILDHCFNLLRSPQIPAMPVSESAVTVYPLHSPVIPGLGLPEKFFEQFCRH